MALGCHEGAILLPSMDRKHNIGKYAFVYSVTCYILKKNICFFADMTAELNAKKKSSLCPTL